MGLVIIYIIIVVEIVIVNLIPVYSCGHKKYSMAVTISVLTAYTIACFLIGLYLLSKMYMFGNGNGIFVFMGFLYLIPLKFLYQDEIKKIFIIMCSVWIYTLCLFSISVQLGTMAKGILFPIITLGVQTILFLSITPFFLRFIKNDFLPILNTTNKKIRKYLLISSITWFFTVFLIHFSLITKPIIACNMVILTLLLVDATITYHLLHEVVIDSKNIAVLKNTAYIDSLTEIKNRRSLESDIEYVTSHQKEFILFYMDLDRFKKVNDLYGHLQGDNYLRIFSKNTSDILNDFGTLYRISGDEFVAIYFGHDINSIIEKIKKVNLDCKDYIPRFLGVSIGYAKYEGEDVTLDELLEEADKKMYQKKWVKEMML